MNYIYHYCADHNDGIKITTIDGILTCKNPVDSIERYKEVKNVIGAVDGVDLSDKLVIRSLTSLAVT